MEVLSPRRLRKSVVDLLTSEVIELDDAAIRLGISIRAIRTIWSKNYEVDTATRFLKELGAPINEVLTLKEFAGIERDPKTNIDLDNVCPDVVAIVGGRPVGIELTAYADNESQDRLSAVMMRVNEVTRTEYASKYPDLHGFSVSYSPSMVNVIPGNKISQFIEQLLGFVRIK
jgi:hypothetical protein